MKLRELYTPLLEVLNLQSPSAEKKKALSSTILRMRQGFQNDTIAVDYAAAETQEAYLITNYPFHIQQLPNILEELRERELLLESVGDHRNACFLGAGPAPEVIGWLGFLDNHDPGAKSATATLIDKYASLWKNNQERVTRDTLAPLYWSGNLQLKQFDADFIASSAWGEIDPGLQQAVDSSSLFVMQNCLSDLLSDTDLAIQNLLDLFTRMPDGSTFVIADFDYTGILPLLRRYEDTISELGLGDVLLSVNDGIQVYVSHNEGIPTVIREIFTSENGLHLRKRTRYYRTVVRKGHSREEIPFTGRTHPNLVPVPLPPPQTPQLTRIASTLATILAPGRKSRLSPYIQAALAQMVFGETSSSHLSEQSWRQLIEENSDIVQEMEQHWETLESMRESLYFGDELTYHAALIAHAPLRIAQLQQTFLDLVQDGHFPDITQFHIQTASVATDIVGALDFLLTLIDVCDLYNVEYLPSQIVFYVPEQSFSETDQDWIEAFIQQIVPIYRDRLPTPILRLGSPFGQIGLSLVDFDESDLDHKIAADTVTVVLHRGDKESSSALMEWRRDFLLASPSFRTLGPCGSELGNRMEACSACDVVRVLALHSNPILQVFKLASPYRISSVWSYVILKGGFNTAPEIAFSPVTIEEGKQLVDPILLRYIGYSQNKQPTIEANDEATGINASFYRVCPALFSSEKAFHRAALTRGDGKFAPRLRFGEAFTASYLIPKILPSTNVRAVQFEINTETEYQQSTPVDMGFLGDYNDQIRNAIDRLGYRTFGFPKMHDFQHEILAEVLTGKSVLGIAATGGGKSECFLLPALLLPGITIVVAPLKSLIQDQIEQRLGDRYGVDFLATFLNGDVPLQERQARLRKAELGYYKIIYTTPEQLERSYMLESLARANKSVGVRYIALDEAHCISQWGHDFRPSYLNIVHRLENYAINPVRIALTATASPKVREDLCRELNLVNKPPKQGGNVLIFSSNRPELNLVVQSFESTEQKTDCIVRNLRSLASDNQRGKQQGAAIVFLPHTGGDLNRLAPITKNDPATARGRTSAGVTPFASFLERSLQRRVSIYHGKVPDGNPIGNSANNNLEREYGDLRGRTRRSEQTRFISGETDIMVATKGFGMGIDKSNVRLVIHRSPPGDLEAYAQEAGRAGRDGQLATALLLYSSDKPTDDDQGREKSDHEIQKHFISERYVNPDDVALLREFLVGHKPHAGSVYFRCFDLISFLDNRGMKWPDLQEIDPNPNPFNLRGIKRPQFPEIAPNPKYTGEHQRVYEARKRYDHKRAYVARLLAAAQKIRPELPIHGGQCYAIETHQEVDIFIDKPSINAEKIIQSNHYYGEILRERGIEAKQLSDLLLSSRSIIRLARALGMSLVDTKALLTDIMETDHYVNGQRSRSTLLQLKLNTIYSDVFTEDEWRFFAGGVRDGNPDRKKKTIEEWFPENKLTRPVGWEVKLGNALNENVFPDYLSAFSAIHNERERNDWDAYHRLLTDYIGASEDGKLNGRQRSQSCLRSVMLGYLKTYEVIVGGNCKSCSVCVPDHRFDDYSLDERRAAVSKMDQLTAELLDELESYEQESPKNDLLVSLFDQVIAEETQGHSIKSYVQSWSARLLQDSPGHRAGLWVRSYGAHYLGFQLSVEEHIRNVEQLIAKADLKDLVRISDLLQALITDFDHPKLRLYLGEILERLERQTEALATIHPILELQDDLAFTKRSHQLALRLTLAGSPARNDDLCVYSLGSLIQLCTSTNERITHFEVFIVQRSLPEIRKLLQDKVEPEYFDEILYAHLIRLNPPDQHGEFLSEILQFQPNWLMTISQELLEAYLSPARLMPLIQHKTSSRPTLIALYKGRVNSMCAGEALLWAINNHTIKWHEDLRSLSVNWFNTTSLLSLSWNSPLRSELLKEILPSYLPTDAKQIQIISKLIFPSIYDIESPEIKLEFLELCVQLLPPGVIAQSPWQELRQQLLADPCSSMQVLANEGLFKDPEDRWKCLHRTLELMKSVMKPVAHEVLLPIVCDLAIKSLGKRRPTPQSALVLKWILVEYGFASQVLKCLEENLGGNDLTAELRFWEVLRTSAPLIVSDQLVNWLNSATQDCFLEGDTLPLEYGYLLLPHYRPKTQRAYEYRCWKWFPLEMWEQDINNTYQFLSHMADRVTPHRGNWDDNLVTLYEKLYHNPETWLHMLLKDPQKSLDDKCAHARELLSGPNGSLYSQVFNITEIGLLLDTVPAVRLDETSKLLNLINQYAPVSWVTQFSDMLTLLNEGLELLAGRPEGRDIIALYLAFNTVNNRQRAYWLAEMLDAFIERQNNDNWLTPVSYLVRAYCHAGLHTKAQELVEDRRDISVDKRSASDYIVEMSAKYPTPYQPTTLDAIAQKYIQVKLEQ